MDANSANANGIAVTQFLDWWQSVLNNDDKFGLFVSLMRWPLPTVAFVGQVWAALEKVFDGRNPVQEYNFLTPEAKADWQEFRERTGLADFIRKQVFDTAKEGKVNSIMYVDLPALQLSEQPEPYVELLDIEDVLGYEYDEGQFEWLAWREDEEKMACFDRFSFRVFSTKPNAVEITGTLVDVKHDLGYTPAQWMWADSVCVDEPELKESPLSKYLGDLDWLLGYKISKRVNEMVAQYPVYWSYQIACDYVYSTPENGVVEQCHGGFLRNNNGEYLMTRGASGHEIAKCPKCRKSRLIGAGSMVHKPFPDGQDVPDIAAPVGVVPAEITSLEYNATEVDRIEKSIYVGVTGAQNEAINNQAVNEKQVGAIVDGKTQVLCNLKGNLENAQKWAESTICKLRYAERFQGMTVNLGTEFHLMTANQLREQYELARKNGESMTSLDRLWEDYLAARFRHDPMMQQRELILMHLDPFRHRTATDVMAVQGIKPELFYLKFNLSSLIMRFEREQTDIITFGSALSFDRKINEILKTLIQYAKEFINDTGSAGTNGGDGATAGNFAKAA